MQIGWLAAFADVPAGRVDAALRFWAAVTDSAAGTPSGELDDAVRPGRPWVLHHRSRSAGEIDGRARPALVRETAPLTQTRAW